MDWKKKARKASYELEDEPLSIVVMKNNHKVVCGTQEGTLAMYTVRHFYYNVDLYYDVIKTLIMMPLRLIYYYGVNMLQ